MPISCTGVCGPIPDLVRLQVSSKLVNGQTEFEVVPESRLWANNSILTYAFLDGSAAQQALVNSSFVEWAVYANVKPVLVEDSSANIRITFSGHGAWSAIGNEALRIEGPSMCLGYVDPDIPTDEHRAIVLHEIGHALGMTHEWDGTKAKVSPDSSPEGQIVLQHITDNEGQRVSNYGRVSRDSIMAYFVPASFTNGQDTLPLNTQLSDGDKSWLTINYFGKLPVVNGQTWKRLLAVNVLDISTYYAARILIGTEAEYIRSVYNTWAAESLGKGKIAPPSGFTKAVSDRIVGAVGGKAKVVPSSQLSFEAPAVQKFKTTQHDTTGGGSGSGSGSSGNADSDADQMLHDVFAALVLNPAFHKAVVNVTNADLPNHKVYEKDYPIPPDPASDIEAQQGILGIIGSVLPLLLTINPAAAGASGVQSGIQANTVPPVIQQGIFDAIVKFTQNPIFKNVVGGIAKAVVNA